MIPVEFRKCETTLISTLAGPRLAPIIERFTSHGMAFAVTPECVADGFLTDRFCATHLATGCRSDNSLADYDSPEAVIRSVRDWDQEKISYIRTRAAELPKLPQESPACPHCGHPISELERAA